MKTLDTPRVIDSANTFNALVQWFHDEMIVRAGAPGFIIGLSGTDSIVSFLAASKAFEKAGKPKRVLGVHFAPSEDFLYDHPEADVHLWFSNEMIPWLQDQAKDADVVVDTSIDWRCDGLRWGSLMEMSVILNEKTRQMRLPEDQYWLIGTRNLTEDMLLNYSNASAMVSVQPIIHLWKSEILQISKYLGIPQVALDKSREVDCICGRLSIVSQNITEIDHLLMVRRGDLLKKYTEDNIAINLRFQLDKFISSQISSSSFKNNIPYSPDHIVFEFENGSLNIKDFDHYKHLYIAWYYLKRLSFEDAIFTYNKYLKLLLDSNGKSHKFNSIVTQSYFSQLNEAIKLHPTDKFDELIGKFPSLLIKNVKIVA